MFICQECLKKHTNNSMSMTGSHGPCEYCGKVRACADIPSKYIIPKNEHKVNQAGKIIE